MSESKPGNPPMTPERARELLAANPGRGDGKPREHACATTRRLHEVEARIDEMKSDDELTTEQVRWLKTGEAP